MKYHIIVIIIIFIICLIVIPFGLFFSLQYFSRASNLKANIYIDTNQSLGPIRPIWKNYAQGGGQSIAPIVAQATKLTPRSIRMDHIFDGFDVVAKTTTGNIQLNFEKLDKAVCNIYETGAKPFFVLGYMPPSFSQSGSLIDQPTNWNDWTYLVQKTIEHYSGKNTLLCEKIKGEQLDNIYYEVWNEPDLDTFGSWSMSGPKNYGTLYSWSVLGAKQAQNVRRFFIGGPVVSSLFPEWVTGFLQFVSSQKLRLDFISWHRYSHKTDAFQTDAATLESILSQPSYLLYRGLPRVISEWGFDSFVNEKFNTQVAAAHTIASIRNMIDYPFEGAFSFELMDNPETNWGIFTLKGEKKARYDALVLLNQLEGNRLLVSGEGTFVSAIASKNSAMIQTILVNYDPQSANSEAVPLTYTNLKPGAYDLIMSDSTGKPIMRRNFPQVSDQLRIQIPLPYNSIIYIQLVSTKTIP